MTNNDVFRRIRYTFDLKDSLMVDIFATADYTVTKEQVSGWLKKEGDESYSEATDTDLAAFLNGFINTRRGKLDGVQPELEVRLNNNMILRKLRIALDMKAEDILETLQVVGFRLSKPELSAFFRKPGHKHYRECKDQILRNFLMGMQRQLRPGDTSEYQQDTDENTDTASDNI